MTIMMRIISGLDRPPLKLSFTLGYLSVRLTGAACAPSLRDRVISSLMERVTAGDPQAAQPDTAEEAETPDGLVGVMGAGWRKTAGRRCNLRDGRLVKFN
jgi:hypothetical protein